MVKIGKILLFIFLPAIVFSQGELDENTISSGRNERTYAFLINSNGWGVNFRFAKRLDGFNKRLFEFDYNGIKHPKEIKSFNKNNPSQRKFVYGKINQFSILRFGIGKQRELFSKADKGGIAIKWYYILGFDLGFLKPVYYEVAYPFPDDYRLYYIKIEKFDFYEQHTDGFVYAKASYFEGLNETKLKPGGFIKLGSSFDFSSDPEKVNSIEAGIILDFFPDVIPIMATKENSSLFPSFFINYRFGKTYSKRLKNVE